MEVSSGSSTVRIPVLVKRAWELRNKIVHGDDPTKAGSCQQIVQTIRDLALVVRKSLQRILRDKTLLTKLDDYLSVAAAIRAL